MEGQGKVKVHGGGSFQLVSLAPRSHPDKHDGLWIPQEKGESKVQAELKTNHGMD